MDATRFDAIAKLFAARRLSRRQALRQSGAGLAAGALVAAGLSHPAAAQDATPPAATDGGQKIAYLFVQAFRSGKIAPKVGAADTFTLTLEQGLGQTVFFSDRPERIVGAAPTQRILDGLGFTPANPPNAALVVEPTPGATEVAVIELFEPRYDETTHTATYDAKVLADYEQSVDLGFTAAPADLAAVAPTFGAAHLLIDDCPDSNITCSAGGTTYGVFQGAPMCWNWGYLTCDPCEPYGHSAHSPDQVHSFWSQQCTSTYGCPAGSCQASWYSTV